MTWERPYRDILPSDDSAESEVRTSDATNASIDINLYCNSDDALCECVTMCRNHRHQRRPLPKIRSIMKRTVACPAVQRHFHFIAGRAPSSHRPLMKATTILSPQMTTQNRHRPLPMATLSSTPFSTTLKQIRFAALPRLYPSICQCLYPSICRGTYVNRYADAYIAAHIV